MTKKRIILILSLISCLILSIFGLGACSTKEDEYSLQLNVESNVLAYQSTFDFDDYFANSYIQKTDSNGEKTKIAIKESMLSTPITTDSIGLKNVKITYNSNVFTFNYSVKYKVDFFADSELFDTQLVLRTSQLDLSKIPTKEGFTFVEWQNVPDTIEGNISINAVFKEKITMPELQTLNAEYGDSLQTITLPSNKFGSWQFADELTEKVGAVGTQIKTVNFVGVGGEILETDTVDIIVSKKNLEFVFNTLNVEYTGSVVVPEYTFNGVDKSQVNVIYVPYDDDAVEIGTYGFDCIIQDDNYQGEYSGQFNIVKKVVKVNVKDLEMTYLQAVPNGTYTLLDSSNNPLDKTFESQLDIEIELPLISPSAGEYEIGIKEKDYTNFELIVQKGCLTVHKATHLVDVVPNAEQVIYGNTLSQIELSSTVSDIGSWSWVDGSIVISAMQGVSAMAKFTPNDTDNYLSFEKQVPLTVLKKTVEIIVGQNQFEYNGLEQRAVINVSGVLSGDDNTYTIQGNLAYTTVGSYDITLTLQSDRYQAQSVETQLVINKGSLADFVGVQNGIGVVAFDKNNTNKLAHVKLPIGYAWANGNQQLVIGQNVGEVIFTPEDKDNVKIEQSTITFNVEKGVSVITVNGNKFTYNKEHDYDFSATLNHDESQLEYKILYEGTEVDSLAQIGSYEITISCAESERYKGATKVVNVEILTETAKYANRWLGEVADIVDGKTIDYGESISLQARYGEIKVNAVGIEGTIFSDEKLPTEAGIYQITLFVEEGVDYTELSKTFKLTILPIQLTLEAPVYKETFFYENIVNVADADNMLSTPVLNVQVPGKFNYTIALGQALVGFKVNVSVSFVPEDTRNYLAPAQVFAPILVNEVAYIGSNFYGSIESALSVAKSGDVVWVCAGEQKAVIASNCTIPVGVTLNIPHTADKMNANGTATLNTDVNIPNVLVKTTIKLNEGVKLTVKGSLQIAGELSGGGGGHPYAGHTTGNTAKIVLGKNAVIESEGGLINVFGLIIEETDNNGSQVIVNGGNLYVPYVVRDFGGGTYMSTVYTKTTGFREFEIRNVTALVTIKNSANVYGYANLYAGEQHNATTATLVSTTEKAVIHFVDANGYLTFKYNIVGGYKNNDSWADGIMDVNIYGGATTDPMTLKVTVKLWILPMTVEVSTKDTFFPISWRLNVALYDGEYTMSYKYKLMPGSVFKVGSGATVNISTLAIYSQTAFASIPSSGLPFVYKANAGDAKFIIENGGSVNVSSAIGGNVILAGGTLTNNGAESVTSPEGISTGSSKYSTQNITLSLTTENK